MFIANWIKSRVTWERDLWFCLCGINPITLHFFFLNRGWSFIPLWVPQFPGWILESLRGETVLSNKKAAIHCSLLSSYRCPVTSCLKLLLLGDERNLFLYYCCQEYCTAPTEKEVKNCMILCFFSFYTLKLYGFLS